MIEALIIIFLLGVGVSFYNSNKKAIDKTSKKIKKSFED